MGCTVFDYRLSFITTVLVCYGAFVPGWAVLAVVLLGGSEPVNPDVAMFLPVPLAQRIRLRRTLLMAARQR